jgi:hypothetical protein
LRANRANGSNRTSSTVFAIYSILASRTSRSGWDSAYINAQLLYILPNGFNKLSAFSPLLNNIHQQRIERRVLHFRRHQCWHTARSDSLSAYDGYRCILRTSQDWMHGYRMAIRTQV